MVQIINSLIRLIKALFSSKKPAVRSKAIGPINKKPNIELLVASPDLNKSIIELDDYICEKCEWGYNLSELSNPQKVFYFNQELEREINNGGFDQYFYNSSGRYANDTIGTLKQIGAEKTARLLESAIELFPDNHVPTDKGLRNQMLEDIRDKTIGIWEGFDERFFKYEDDLSKLNMEFVRKNIQHF